jgi:hypothetical protein
MAVLALVLSLALLPMVLDFIFELEISFLESSVGVASIGAWMTDMVNGALGNMASDLPGVSALVVALPKVFLAIPLFGIIWLIINIILRIVYYCTVGLVDGKNRGDKKRSGKLAGAGISAVHGLLIAFLVFAPVFGMANLASPVVNSPNFNEFIIELEYSRSIQGVRSFLNGAESDVLDKVRGFLIESEIITEDNETLQSGKDLKPFWTRRIQT